MTNREPGTRLGWVDCSSGVSGDMLLGALDQLGALTDLPRAVASVPELGARVSRSSVDRAGVQAGAVQVTADSDQPLRRLADVRAIVTRMEIADSVRDDALRVFDRLATAEAEVHGTSADEVHFHEVGAVDAVVDVVGACLGFRALGLEQVSASTVALGAGTTRSAHGVLPVPAPAVLQLLAAAGLSAQGGPVEGELATPTGVALLAELVRASGPMPAMTVDAVGVGAGQRQYDDHANVVRIVVGEAVADVPVGEWLLLEANVDDLDPRLWPGVIDALLAAGAVDAWVAPILMKKGRPAHTVSALAPTRSASVIRSVLFRETSTIGVRVSPVEKHALERSVIHVDVDGQPVAVKLASLDGAVVSATPEWEDVSAAARALGRPAKRVLADAAAAAAQALD